MSSLIGTLNPTDFMGDGLDIIDMDRFARLVGTEQGEFIDAGDGKDVIFGRKGNDFIDAGTGRDVINAGTGDDSVIGGADDDIIFGLSGNDFLEGSNGNDRIFGNNGDDIVNGGAGNDTISGGRGNDTLYGGAGSDQLFGDAGQDVFLFDIQDFADGSIDTIADFQFGNDRIIVIGLAEEDQISFDSTTGSISYNGNNIIDVKGAKDAELNIEEDDNGNYEIM